MSEFPEIRVVRQPRGSAIAKVLWVARDGTEIDLTPMGVVRVTRTVSVSEPPRTKVTFHARLVEFEGE